MAEELQVQDLTRELIKSKSPDKFFCYIHLEDLALKFQSPDLRYCQICCDLLLSDDDGLEKRAEWYPVLPKTAKQKKEDEKTINNRHQKAPDEQINKEKAMDVPELGPINLSTLKKKNINDKKLIEVDKLNSKQKNKPGPVPANLPLDIISQWAGKGLGSKAITMRLEKEYKVVISYRTIQRRLQGRLFER